MNKTFFSAIVIFLVGGAFAVKYLFKAPPSVTLVHVIRLNLSGQYQEAAVQSDILTRLEPENFDAWINKGMALISLGYCAEATAAAYHATMMENIGSDSHQYAEVFLDAIRSSPDCVDR